MTEVYLALGGSINNLRSSFQDDPAPAALLSYVYFDMLEDLLATGKFRYWVLDSGAFTAHQKGKPIQVQDYIEFCHKVLAGPNPPKEVYSLDVIGDWQETAKNTEAMWDAGIKAIPTYHIGEPADALISMAKRYPKIALGGVAGMGKRAVPFFKQCFARVWPKPMHAFGVHSEEVLMSFPFHSADATNWQLGPTRFGSWKCYGDFRPEVRSGFHLRPQVDLFLEMERKLKAKWRGELARFKDL